MDALLGASRRPGREQLRERVSTDEPGSQTYGALLGSAVCVTGQGRGLSSPLPPVLHALSPRRLRTRIRNSGRSILRRVLRPFRHLAQADAVLGRIAKHGDGELRHRGRVGGKQRVSASESAHNQNNGRE
jgi:hypothetical protein